MTNLHEDELKIRRATTADVETLAALGARTFRDTYAVETDAAAAEDYIAAHFTTALIAAEMADPAATFLLADAQGQSVGYAKLRVGPAPDCVQGPRPVELSRLYLERGVIGKGYGAALMRACLAEAERMGRETMWLGIWEGNERARLFYGRWGFTEVGTHKFLFGGELHDDPVFMRPVRPDAAASEA